VFRACSAETRTSGGQPEPLQPEPCHLRQPLPAASVLASQEATAEVDGSSGRSLSSTTLTEHPAVGLALVEQSAVRSETEGGAPSEKSTACAPQDRGFQDLRSRSGVTERAAQRDPLSDGTVMSRNASAVVTSMPGSEPSSAEKIRVYPARAADHNEVDEGKTPASSKMSAERSHAGTGSNHEEAMRDANQTSVAAAVKGAEDVHSRRSQPHAWREGVCTAGAVQFRTPERRTSKSQDLGASNNRYVGRESDHTKTTDVHDASRTWRFANTSFVEEVDAQQGAQPCSSRESVCRDEAMQFRTPERRASKGQKFGAFTGNEGDHSPPAQTPTLGVLEARGETFPAIEAHALPTRVWKSKAFSLEPLERPSVDSSASSKQARSISKVDVVDVGQTSLRKSRDEAEQARAATLGTAVDVVDVGQASLRKNRDKVEQARAATLDTAVDVADVGQASLRKSREKAEQSRAAALDTAVDVADVGQASLRKSRDKAEQSRAVALDTAVAFLAEMRDASLQANEEVGCTAPSSVDVPANQQLLQRIKQRFHTSAPSGNLMLATNAEHRGVTTKKRPHFDQSKDASLSKIRNMSSPKVSQRSDTSKDIRWSKIRHTMSPKPSQRSRQRSSPLRLSVSQRLLAGRWQNQEPRTEPETLSLVPTPMDLTSVSLFRDALRLSEGSQSSGG